MNNLKILLFFVLIVFVSCKYSCKNKLTQAQLFEKIYKNINKSKCVESDGEPTIVCEYAFRLKNKAQKYMFTDSLLSYLDTSNFKRPDLLFIYNKAKEPIGFVYGEDNKGRIFCSSLLEYKILHQKIFSMGYEKLFCIDGSSGLLYFILSKNKIYVFINKLNGHSFIHIDEYSKYYFESTDFVLPWD